MVLFTIYHQLHQPFRLNPGFRLNSDRSGFFWDKVNKEIFNKVAEKNYIPATNMFAELIEAFPDFKLTLSMSGTLLEQAQNYTAFGSEVIASLQKLIDAGKKRDQVEILGETYYHSVAGLFGDPNRNEFREQVALHRELVQKLFGVTPTSFRNTELMYNNDIAGIVSEMGYKSMLCEYRADMADRINPENPINRNHKVFRARGKEGNILDFIVIPRDRDISDDIAYRFSHTPITIEKYVANVDQIAGEIVLAGHDYEHIGEHIWKNDTKYDIFDFWKGLPAVLAQHPNIVMANPTEIAERFRNVKCPVVDIDGLSTSSWADTERNTYGWLGNDMQKIIFKDMEYLEEVVKKIGGDLLEKWRHMTTSCHLHNIYRSIGSDGDVHSYFSAHESVDSAIRTLTRAIDYIESSAGQEITGNFNILKKSQQTPVIIITPETARLPTEGMGDFAKYVSGKSGGLGEVVAALSKGLVERGIPTYFITLNLRRRFMEESHMSEEEWIQRRHKLHPENICLVSSSLWENNFSAYDGNPIITAAEFQKQVINSKIKDITSQYNGKAIIHTHDWMAGGAIVAYAKLRKIPVLHTVHNTHTGHIPLDTLLGINMNRMWQNLYLSWDNGQRCLDSQATAIKSATKISYVGDQFLKEIVNDHFMDLPIIHGSVRQETKEKYANGDALVIPNGISPELFPENQKENARYDMPGLAKAYSHKDHDIISAKKANLRKFQAKTGLIQDEDAILLYWPSRLDQAQKGVELLESIAHEIIRENPDVQIAVVGNPVGNDRYHADVMGRIACASRGRITYQPFSEDLSILGYAAASDVFGASLYEPFGQIDVLGNIFGATATNRDTGGYHDKIRPEFRNGRLFKDYDSAALKWALTQAINQQREFRNNPSFWNGEAGRIMKEAKERWSLDNMVMKTLTVYTMLNAGRSLVNYD